MLGGGARKILRSHINQLLREMYYFHFESDAFQIKLDRRFSVKIENFSKYYEKYNIEKPT